MVKHFLTLGWEVIFTGTSQASVSQLMKDLRSPETAFGYVSDFSQPDSVSVLIDQMQEDGHQVQHLVNNARNRDNLGQSESLEVSRSAFLSEYELNVVAPYELGTGLSNLGSELRTVTNIGSQYGLVAANPSLYGENPTARSPIHYGVAKSALHHLTKELAVRFAQDGIRVNAVALGGVRSERNTEFAERYGQFAPIGRMLWPEEIAGPVEFLVSEKSSGVTGHVLVVDGGWTAW